MAIQHIDMAVPVGKAVGDKDAAARAAGDLAELEVMQARLRALVRATCSLEWRQSRRGQRQQQFDAEIRALIKKFSSAQAASIEDRNDRATVRAQLYTDLLALAQDLRMDVGARQAVFVHRLIRLLAGVAALTLVLSAALAILTLL